MTTEVCWIHAVIAEESCLAQSDQFVHLMFSLHLLKERKSGRLFGGLFLLLRHSYAFFPSFASVDALLMFHSLKDV